MCDCNKTYNFQLGCSPQIKLANPNSYYTKSEIDDMLDEIEISGGCGCDLSEYATLKDLENAEDALWQDINVLEEELSTKADKEALDALKQEMEALSDKQAEYPTKEWVEGQGYLTEHQHLKTINGESLVGDGNIIIEGGTSVDLSNYYTKTESDGRYGTLEEQKSLRNDVEEALGEAAKNEAELQKKADRSDLADYQPKGDYALRNEIPSLEGYATEQWVTDKNYLTEHQHLKTINGNSLIGDGNIIIEGGGEPIDLSDYYTKEESDERYAQKSIVDSIQSQIDEFDGELSTKADKEALEALQQEIDELEKSGSEVNQELSRLDSEVDTLRDRVDSKADRSDLADYQPKGDYVTEGSLEDKLSEYPTKDEINDLEGRIEDLEVYDFEEFATKEWIEGQGYLTEYQHLKTINGESLVGDGNIEIKAGSEPIDAYTKEESDARYGSKSEQESLRSDVEDIYGEVASLEADKADKSEIPSLDGYATEQWVEDKHYLTEHQDISNLATKEDVTAVENKIPSLDGYATEDWVNDKHYLTEHQDISNLATKEELNEAMSSIVESNLKIWQGTIEEYDELGTYDENTLYLLYDN